MKPKYNKGFTPMGNVLSDRIKEYKLQGAFYKHQALKYWASVIVGYVAEAKEQTRAIDLRNGVLVIACLSKDLAYQIKLLAQRIIAEINRLIGQSVVFAIYTEV